MKTSEILKDSVEPVGKEIFVRFMKRCGYLTIPEQVEGERADGSKCFKTVWTIQKLPGCKGASHVSLSFIKSTDKLRLSYPHPYDGREISQHFDFDVVPFLHAYEESKYKRSTPKDWYLSFEDTFFNMTYPKANKFIRFIFDVFSITPSIVKKCVRQNKNLKRKIDLEVKNRRYFEFLGLERKIIHPGVKNAEKEAKIDVELEQLAKKNMIAAVNNGAKNYDLNYFKQYVMAYIDLCKSRRIYGNVSKRLENKLFEEYCKKVKDVQKNSIHF
jgi:hypothetical protein